jgi:hypothetical protein
MPWIDHGGRSEFRDGGIVKARVVARRGVGWEATDLTGKLSPLAPGVGHGPSEPGEQLVGTFRSLGEAKAAIDSLWNYVDRELPGSD